MQKAKIARPLPIPENKFYANKIIAQARVKPARRKLLAPLVSSRLVLPPLQPRASGRPPLMPVFIAAKNIRPRARTKLISRAGLLAAAAMFAAAVLPWRLQLSSASASSVAYQNGYPTIGGNYIDCEGNVDNDPAHHATDPSDTDPAHHSGQDCPAGSFIASLAGNFAAAGNPSANGAAANNPAWSADENTNTAAAAGGLPASNVLTEDAAQAAALTQVIYKNGYPTIGGNYVDCDGSDDNDSTHHEPIGSDTDPGHHLGLDCPAGSLIGSLNSRTINNSTASGGLVPAAPPPTTPALQPAPNNGNIFSGTRLYFSANNNAENYADQIRGGNASDASLLDKIGSQPTAVWLGDFTGDVQNTVASIMSAAQSAGQLPVFVLYNIPDRDCGGFSSGGGTAAQYRQWIGQVAAGLGRGKAAVIIEPDATALTGCLSAADLLTRYELLAGAVNTFKQNGQAVYLDAGHPGWISPADMASRLQQAGIGQADGFAVNISNFYSTADDISYGQALSALLGGKHFVVDTSRNGNGPAPDGQWCNPADRALGQTPTASTGNSLVDAFLWVKYPGESDGSCGSGPSAGTFWPAYAEALSQNAPR